MLNLAEPFYAQENYETHLRLYAIKEMYGETNIQKAYPDERVNLIADSHYAARLEEIRASVDVGFPAWSGPRWAYERKKFSVETVGA